MGQHLNTINVSWKRVSSLALNLGLSFVCGNDSQRYWETIQSIEQREIDRDRWRKAGWKDKKTTKKTTKMKEGECELVWEMSGDYCVLQNQFIPWSLLFLFLFLPLAAGSDTISQHPAPTQGSHSTPTSLPHSSPHLSSSSHLFLPLLSDVSIPLFMLSSLKSSVSSPSLSMSPLLCWLHSRCLFSGLLSSLNFVSVLPLLPPLSHLFSPPFRWSTLHS